MPLKKEQTDLITATVPLLAEHGQQITSLFYKRMLSEYPELNALFNQANQLNGHQAQALASAVYAYAANINNLENILPAVDRINHKHASLYIKPEQYDIVGKYLLAAIVDVLHPGQDIVEAWAAAYKQLADLMIEREAEILSHAEGWTDWRDFKIAQRVKESDEITSFCLEPVDGKPLPAFLPGQYISVRTYVPSLKYLQPRQYSLSDTPDEKHYRISVKRDSDVNGDAHHPVHPGYISNILHDTKNVGDMIQVSHPAGEFYLDVQHTDFPIVLLSAGVGLTPLLSMLNTLHAQNSARRISWIHVSKTPNSLAFGQHVRSVVESHENMTEKVFISRPFSKEVDAHKDNYYDFEGRMDLSKLDEKKDLMLDSKDARYYICGPEKFMHEVGKALEERGVDPERVNVEVFGTGGLPKV